MVVVWQQVNEALQFMLATFPNNVQLIDEYVRDSIAGKK